MGLNLKEKWQSLNKKNLAILVVVLLLVVGAGVGIFEYVQYKNFKKEAYQANEEQIIKDIFGQTAEQEAPPTKKPSEYKIGISYDKAMSSKKPALVLFYADWCGYCIRFMPVYQELSKKYKDDLNFAKVNVEDPKYKAVVNEIGITGFPTVFIIDPKYDNRVLISNAHLGTAEQVSVELDRFLRIRKLLDEKK